MKLFIEIVFFVVAAFNLGLIVRSLLYNRITFRKKLLPAFRKDYRPKVAVFVPCKGMEENLGFYLEAMVNQDYPDYTVTFITESESDAAVEIITKVVGRYPLARHVVSGRTQTCCQKNHNHLKALALDRDSEVFIFADADVKPGKNWIADLVMPLSCEDIPASTGFRWLTPPRSSIQGTIHSMMSAYICILMSSSKGLWGGSMAIRRKDFEKYHVADLWSRTVVDDITLTRILVVNNLKRVFVPHCIAVSGNTLTTLKGNIEWFTRQLVFLRLYCRPMWLAALGVYSFLALLLALAFLFVAAALLVPGFNDLGFLSLLFILSFMISMSLVRFNYADGQNSFLWGLLALPAMFVGFVSLIQSGMGNEMLWRNIRYTFTADGTVKSVEFLDSQP